MPLTDKEVKSAIRSKWDVSSEKYDTHDGHGIKTAEERDAWKKLLGEAVPGDKLSILDVGCGTGELSLVLSEMGHKVQGIDLSEKMLSKARAKARDQKLSAKFSSGDAENLKFGNQSFDAVVSRHLLWTLPNPEKAISEWMRVTRKGGAVIVIDGEWRDGTASGRVKRLASEVGALIVERKNPWKAWYSPELISALPNRYGLKPQKAAEYLEASGLGGVTLVDLDDILAIQKKCMPLYRRIGFSWKYYLARGTMTQ